MEIVRIDETTAERLAEMVAAFRVTLQGFRGTASEPDIDSAKEEILYHVGRGCPVFAAEEGGEYLGYVVCRIDEPCLWVEQLFVREEYRRRGIASLLFDKAEEEARGMGEDTVYNFVHPNNERVIAFLRSKGYTVLNLVEVRKPYAGEKLTQKIPVGNNEFDY